ncbi:hypothetical protein BH11PAT4_BH11PAT4_5460 [soil metagenome]
MTKIFTTLFAIVLTAAVLAQSDTLIYRNDNTRGADKPFETLGFLSKTGAEVWIFGSNTKASSLEIGKLWPVLGGRDGFLLVGGYAAYQPQTQQIFAEPFALGHLNRGRVRLAGVIGCYVPLNGGTQALFSDEIALTYHVGRKVRVGVAGSFWAQEGATPTYRFGPVVIVPLSDRMDLALRSQSSNKGTTTVRVELKLKF